MADHCIDIAFFEHVEGVLAMRLDARDGCAMRRSVATEQVERGRGVGCRGKHDDAHRAGAGNAFAGAAGITRHAVACGEQQGQQQKRGHLSHHWANADQRAWLHRTEQGQAPC